MSRTRPFNTSERYFSYRKRNTLFFLLLAVLLIFSCGPPPQSFGFCTSKDAYQAQTQSAPSWSPDGHWLLYSHVDKFRRKGCEEYSSSDSTSSYLLNLETGRSSKVDGFGFEWSDDSPSVLLSVDNENKPYLFNPQNQEKKALTRIENATRYAWAPDGNILQSFDPAGSTFSAVITRPTGEEVRKLGPFTHKAETLPDYSWLSNSGQLLVLSSQAATSKATWNLSLLRYGPNPDEKVTLWSQEKSTANVYSLMVSPDEKYARFILNKPSAPRTTLYLVDLSTTKIRPIFEGESIQFTSWDKHRPSWTRNSEFLAFSGKETISDDHEIFSYEIGTGQLRQLTHTTGRAGAAENRDATWSPDLREIIFSSNKDSETIDRKLSTEDLYRLNIKTRVLTRLTCSHAALTNGPLPDWRCWPW
ncbi:MAG: hypothetical protein ACAI44_30440 [Candidatus Sericytochromatia bacterium]